MSPCPTSAPAASHNRAGVGATVGSTTTSTRRRRAPRTPAASSASGPPARTSPSSPTSASTRCSTAARSRPGSRSATAARSWSTRTWGWSPRSSTRPRSTRSRATWRSATARYSTTGASTWQNAQPTFRPTADGSIALGHNGNLINTHELQQLVEDLPDPEGELPLHTRDVETSTNDTGLVTALLAHHPDTSLEQRALEVLPLLQGRVLVRLDERGHAVRRPRPAGHPAAGPRPARPRLGGRLRGRRPGHHRRQRGPRDRARRAGRHRRARPAHPQVRRAGPQGLRLRVRLPRPPGRHHQRPACTPPASRWAASWPASSRSRPTW